MVQIMRVSITLKPKDLFKQPLNLCNYLGLMYTHQIMKCEKSSYVNDVKLSCHKRFLVVALLEVTRFARKLKDRIFVFISNSNILHQ